jgi:hypothetical protein
MIVIAFINSVDVDQKLSLRFRDGVQNETGKQFHPGHVRAEDIHAQFAFSRGDMLLIFMRYGEIDVNSCHVTTGQRRNDNL